MLRNTLGLTDPDEWAFAEARLSAMRLEQLALAPLPGLYDLAHLRLPPPHLRRLLPWAGELRRVNIARSPLFAAWQQIEPCAADVFDDPKRERYLRDLGRDRFLMTAGGEALVGLLDAVLDPA
ncbi:hypothetical protein ACWEFJ_14120 [Actinosynnema sp. NPDC004786]